MTKAWLLGFIAGAVEKYTPACSKNPFGEHRPHERVQWQLGYYEAEDIDGMEDIMKLAEE